MEADQTPPPEQHSQVQQPEPGQIEGLEGQEGHIHGGHGEMEEEWDASKHGGMSREQLREYADKLDLEVRQLPLDQVFDSIQNGTHILFFGSVICAHTQQFTAIWLNAQYKLDFYAYNQVPHFSFAKVQCADNQPLCFNLMRDEGYPTIVLFHEGIYVEEYRGDRDYVYDFVEHHAKVAVLGDFSEYAGKGSIVERPVIEEVHFISHQGLAVEAVGGTKGLMESMLPVSLVCTLLGVVLVAAYLLRRFWKKGSSSKVSSSSSKGKYTPIEA
ncbi:hypothetical protein BC830DRAFT_1112817 [Chytriomyces sp. MP71]|nr:hypothetical protein BC830DRAFT_1112817 [Chytriomyces sp. MP71]